MPKLVCLDFHSKRARHAGVTEQRLYQPPDPGLEVFENSGATRRDRTGDLLITNQPLYQLS